MEKKYCLICKKTFFTYPSKNKRFCSYFCSNIWKHKNYSFGFQIGHVPKHKGTHICFNTGKTRFKKGYIGYSKNKKLPYRSGINHWNWRGGLSKNKIYQALKQKKQRHKNKISKKYLNLSNIKNKKTSAEYMRIWRKNNPIKAKQQRKFYKYNLKNAGQLTIQKIQQVYENNIKQYGTLTCYLCLKPIEFGKDHLEHKTPLSRGGTNEYNNLAIACQKCNCSKHTKTLNEFKKGGI